MAKVFIYDEFSPEDIAMMQALYSRSPKSVVEHAEKVKQAGSGKFMATYYVGYGHASIADCGSTTIFIEDISILADKAIQDWQLYSGQETSTRYVDMGTRAIVDPIGSPAAKAIIDRWMGFYNGHQEKIDQYLMTKYPRRPEENEAVYTKAIKARGFDIMRGFLPAGITTQLSWHTNLRQAWDHLALLRYHPLEEVKTIAEEILNQLKTKYSHSFSHVLFDTQEKYRADMAGDYTYFAPEGAVDFSFSTTVKDEDLKKYQRILDERPIKTGLPNFLADLGLCTFEMLLDFGSFRDLQRHRSGICRMPLLTMDLGFNAWYLGQLPEDMRQEAEKLIAEQKTAIEALGATATVKQYYIPLGYDVLCRNTYPLPATAYVIELRSGKAVHPTLRAVAHKMHRAIMSRFPQLKLQSDLDLDDWDVRRGLQDIVSRDNQPTAETK